MISLDPVAVTPAQLRRTDRGVARSAKPIAEHRRVVCHGALEHFGAAVSAAGSSARFPALSTPCSGDHTNHGSAGNNRARRSFRAVGFVICFDGSRTVVVGVGRRDR